MARYNALLLALAAHGWLRPVPRAPRAPRRASDLGWEDDELLFEESWDDDEAGWAPKGSVFASGAATLLVGVDARESSAESLGFEASMRELGDLAASAGLEVAGTLRQRRAAPDPQTYVDAAFCDTIRDEVRAIGDRVVVLFDGELSPDQQRALEKKLQVESMYDLLPRARRPDRKRRAMDRQREAIETGLTTGGALGGAAARARRNRDERVKRRGGLEEVKLVRVVDRTALVLEIFARRATTKAGRLQVALAETLYRTPRLTEVWKRVEEDDALGGSLGSNKQERRRTREIDQKRMRDRAARLRRELAALGRHRENTRKRRSREPAVALVGYTNAGKSSLLAALCGDDVEVLDADDEDNRFSVDSKPFATLDPLTRRVALGGVWSVVTDTVGFVSRLPAHVVAAFRATLEEVREADVLVHVVDASSPSDARRRVVDAELDALGAGETPCVLFFNKVDALSEGEAAELRASVEGADACCGSAARGDLGGLPEVLAAVLSRPPAMRDVAVTLPFDGADSGALLDEIRRRGRVDAETYSDAGTGLVAAVPYDLANRLRPYRTRAPR